MTNRLSLVELVKPFDRRANFSPLYPFNIPSIPLLPPLPRPLPRGRLSSASGYRPPLSISLSLSFSLCIYVDQRAENYASKGEARKGHGAIPRHDFERWDTDGRTDGRIEGRERKRGRERERERDRSRTNGLVLEGEGRRKGRGTIVRCAYENRGGGMG